MKNTKLVDSIELPLKSLDDVLTAVNKVLSSGLNKYLSQFIAPFIGDWPMQFFIRQLVHSNSPMVPATLKNVIPLIGTLHISLNARECVLLLFHELFADLYAFSFWKKSKAGQKTKALESIFTAGSNIWRVDTSERYDFVCLLQVQRH